MDNDGDRTGAADSRGESPEEPDEFDSVVLDEAFIAAGIPESSLPRYRTSTPPPAPIERGRPAGSPEPGIFQHNPDTENWPPRSTHSSRQRRTTGILLGLAAFLVVGVLLAGFSHLRTTSPAAGDSTGSSNASFEASADAARHQIALLGPVTTAGSCFNVQVVETSSPYVDVQTCLVKHEYELVGVEQAAGSNDAYPSSFDWQRTVDRDCARDLQTVSGQPQSNWPSIGVRVGSLPPTPDGWASGDRTVYCIADSVPSRIGSLHELNTAAARPTA